MRKRSRSPRRRRPPGKRTAHALLLAAVALVCLLAIPFGATRPWAFLLGGALSGLLLSAVMFAVATGRLPERAPAGWLAIPGLCWLATLVWIWVQGQPWTPAAWHFPLWAEARAVLGQAGQAIAIRTDAIPFGLVRMGGYAALFVAVFVVARAARPDAALDVLLAFQAAVAVYGLAAFIVAPGHIFWFPREDYFDSVTGTFINKNGFAAFAGLGLLIAATRIAAALAGVARPGVGPVVQAAAVASRLLSHGPLLFAVIVLGGALVMANSRAGTLSTLLALAVLIVLLGVSRTYRWGGRTMAGALAAIAVVIGALLVLAGGSLLDRVGDVGISAATRGQVYALALDAAAQRPFLGHGYRSFEPVFMLYRPGDPALQPFDTAHNIYLDNLVDLGLPVAALPVVAVLIVAGVCLRGVLVRREGVEAPAIAVAATVLLGAHGLVDFSLQYPAICAWFALLLGLGAAAAFRRSELVTAPAADPAATPPWPAASLGT